MRLKLPLFSSFTWGSACVFFGLTAPHLTGWADDWPQWRGPNHNGISAEKQWRDHWPPGGPPILWKASVGTGFSSFAVAKGRVYTMGNAEDKDTVFCFDAVTGKERWTHSYSADLGDKYFDGGTTGTPTVEGDRVFTLSRWGDLFCLDAATGKVVWTRNMEKDTHMRVPTWGFSGSPMVFEKLLLLTVGDAGMALDKETGKTVWQSANKAAGYSTPVPWQHGGKWLALISSSQGYLAVELQTGKEQWRMRWITQYSVNAADPVVDNDRVFISTGYGKGGALLKPDASPEPTVLWKNKTLRTQRNAAVLVGGHLFGVDGDADEKSELKCVDIATGWRHFLDYANGTLGDWGVHWLDQVLWWTEEKYPRRVFSSGGRQVAGKAILDEREQTTDVPDHQVATFEFEKFTCVWEHRHFAGNEAERHKIGAYFYGTRGTLHIGWRDGWTFYPTKRTDKPVHEDSQLQEPDGHNLKLLWADFLDAIDGKHPPVASIDIAHRASVLPLLGMLSWRLGRSVEWDGAKEQIVGDPAANQLLSRAYRAPWKYPEV